MNNPTTKGAPSVSITAAICGDGGRKPPPSQPSFRNQSTKLSNRNQRVPHENKSCTLMNRFMLIA
jgi:hypothetical protein